MNLHVFVFAHQINVLFRHSSSSHLRESLNDVFLNFNVSVVV